MNRIHQSIIFCILVSTMIYSQNGIVNSYYPNKNFRESKSFVNGILDGTSYWFYENGNIKEEKTFSSGKLNGKVRNYYETGLVKEEITVVNGVRHGQYKSYYENGALKEIREYEQGKLIRKQDLTFDANYNPPLEAYLGNRQNEIRKNREQFICEIEECPKPAGGITEIQNNLVYPEYARLYGLEGIVKILVTVDERGNVTATQIIKELGLGCEQAAVDAVLKSKFLPGFDKGKAVTAQVIFNVEFKLTDAEKKLAVSIHVPGVNTDSLTTEILNSVPDQTLESTTNSTIENPKTEEIQKVSENFECDLDVCPVPIGGLQSVLENLVIPGRIKRLKITGDITVEADVDEYGLVRDTKVISGLGYGADDAVEVAILNTLFTPGKKDGIDVRAKVKIIVPIILAVEN